MTDSDFPTRTEGEGETLDLPEGLRPLTPGQVSGQRFRILSPLGRGGMGEVWRAFDLKLRVEVALKALRPELLADPRRLELLREEVRVARQVTSPNVCRVYDLVEVEGRELVSMEYVDGRTLLDELKERAPLDPTEAQALAAQFLSGLEAIHEAGLVHRDVKPENIMLTRTGRVVVMDFGIARSAAEGAGSVSGTPAYMAPEQARGAPADLRSDIFSVGVMLAEMVSPGGIRDFDSRQSVWEGLRREPVEVPQSPWAAVIRKAVAKEPSERFASTVELQRALEDLAFRVHDERGLEPYPGLSAFDLEDREFFFGREAEVERVWTRLESAHLLAVVGASGVGKSSFLGAGVIPARPEGWGVLRCTPGTDVMAALRRVVEDEIGEEVANNDDALVAGFTSWGLKHQEALLVVDQFEEVFTQNPAEAQRRVAALIGRLVLDADVHVLLSLRDDFLLRCHEHAELTPAFSELTPLRTPVGGALRRAVVQPALRCGYRFEDEELADELLAEVEGERGALPLLAFALARLWERRDRETGILTREAYREIGGVEGALAQHAEATIDRIGVERIPIVRELFRNLVTAEGTRAVREWNELLSIFEYADTKREGINPSPTMLSASVKAVGAGFIPARENAEEVLRELIDARLLTSYEIHEDAHEPTRRIEIIHESLLANWPRLVRWQTQDQESAQLRDELRQAARAWDEHGRQDDRLWTGTTLREYQLWRERYPGGLTNLEEAFAVAMSSLANRQRRRRRVAMTAGFAVLFVVLAVVTSLWRQSVRETRRAEAQKLIALGQLELEADPTEAFAWAVASLEVSDTREGRVFALTTMSKGPIARFIQPGVGEVVFFGAAFSPDDEWVALSGYEEVSVYGRSGGHAVFTDAFPTMGLSTVRPFFDISSHFLGASKADEIRTYEVPGFAEIARSRIDGPRRTVIPTDAGVYLVNWAGDSPQIERWRFGTASEPVLELPPLIALDVVPSGAWVAFVSRDTTSEVHLQSLIEPGLPARRIHSSDGPIDDILLDPALEWVAVRGGESDAIALWSLDGDPVEPLRVFDGRGLGFMVDDGGSRLVQSGMLDGHPNVFVWDLSAPPGAEPLLLRSQPGQGSISVTFDPSGRWIGAGMVTTAAFWPLPEKPTLVFPGDGELVYDLAFTSDGAALVIPLFGSRGVRLQPIAEAQAARPLLSDQMYQFVDMDPRGRFAVVGGNLRSQAVICPLDGSEPTRLGGFAESAGMGPVAYDSERNLVAGGVYKGPAEEKIIRVWNLDDGSVQVLGPTEDAGDSFEGGYWGLDFLPDGSLLSASEGEGGVVRRWRLDDGTSEVLFPGDCRFAVAPDGRTAVVACYDTDRTTRKAGVLDLETNELRPCERFQGNITSIAISNSGDRVAMGTDDGTIQVGRLSGGEPHLLFGHAAPVFGMAFSPDDRLLASADQGGTIRVWNVPDLSKPPLQTIPHAELMAKLKTLTNLRVVRDEASSAGWKVEVGPFPGWAEAPTW